MRGKGPGEANTATVPHQPSIPSVLSGAMAVSLLLTALILLPPRLRQRRTSWSNRSRTEGSVDVAERLVLDAGGEVGRRISIIDGFAAKVPIELTGLDGSPAIVSVTPDASVRLLGNVDGIDPNKHPGSWWKVAKNTKLHEMWQRGWTGSIDVALIDSGVASTGHRHAGDQRPRPLVRLAGSESDRHRHLWPRHPHGGF